MLMSRLCGDEFGVLWKYFIASSAGKDDGAAPDNIESIRIELAAVVTERQRLELCRPALVSDVRSLQCQTEKQMAIKFADKNNQIGDQMNQISDLQRSTQMLVNQNQQMQQQMQQMQEQTQTQIQKMQEQMQQRQEQMQDQMRQMHALLMTRADAQSDDGDERGKRAVKWRRTGR